MLKCESPHENFQMVSTLALEAIPILRQQNNWVGGSKIRPFLLMFSTVFMLIRWVGGVPKDQKYADVI